MVFAEHAAKHATALADRDVVGECRLEGRHEVVGTAGGLIQRGKVPVDHGLRPSRPQLFQGTRLRSEGSPMLNLKPPEGVPQGVLELERSLLGRLAAAHRDSRPGVPDLQARISSYELAARMQLSATDALDLSHESEATREMYKVMGSLA